MGRQELARAQISNLRVLACGVVAEQYPRDDTLWESLSRSGVKVMDLRIRQDFIATYQDSLNKAQTKREDILHRIFGRVTLAHSVFNYVAATLYAMLWNFKYAVSISWTVYKKKANIIFVFPRNHRLTIYLGLLKFFHGTKVYFDLFVSVYSIATANHLRKPQIAMSWLGEFLSIKLADQLICVTPEYARYFSKLYKTRIDKFSVVYDGVQDIWFDESVSTSHEIDRPKQALYWGTYLIQHGLDVIIGAAEELKNEDIEFIFCGGGNREAWVKEEVSKRKLNNVIFKGFIATTKELIRLIDTADVTFGHLTNTHDAKLEAPCKTKQGMARAKPVITLWTKQMEDLYQTKDNPFPPLILINPTPKSLAKAIVEITSNPQKGEKIGQAAQLMVKKLHSVEALTSQLGKCFEKAH